jgi:predicted butyrate kinase (DUF1464 family)
MQHLDILKLFIDNVTILMKVSNNRVNNSIDKKCVIDKLHHIILYIEYTSPLAGFEFTTLVLISTICINHNSI